eukprot:11358120-Karenia_brevis.AAC.1
MCIRDSAWRAPRAHICARPEIATLSRRNADSQTQCLCSGSLGLSITIPQGANGLLEQFNAEVDRA